LQTFIRVFTKENLGEGVFIKNMSNIWTKYNLLNTEETLELLFGNKTMKEEEKVRIQN
jgi:hypothetical protein